MLRVVLRNLLSNAIKFSQLGGEINIVASSQDALVQVSVEDHGIGMDAAWYENLIENGRPEVKSGTSGEKGTGFGLLITKDFVEMNGGELLCKSEIGKGTIFSFVGPFRLSQTVEEESQNDLK